MSYTLGELLIDIGLKLGSMNTISTATGGTAATLVDSTIRARASEFKDATVSIIRTADGLAPQFEFSKIASFDPTNYTFGLSQDFSASVEDGDEYCIFMAQFSLAHMIRSINTGLSEIGDIEFTDTASLASLENITEYVSSVGWNKKRPTRIYMQTNTDANDNRWVELVGWNHVLPSAPGQTGLIIFKSPLPSGYDLKIVYHDNHPRVSNFNDPISESVQRPLAVAASINIIRQYFAGLTQYTDESAVALANKAEQNLAEAISKYPVYITKSKGKGFEY